jgi:hypothetical protein
MGTVIFLWDMFSFTAEDFLHDQETLCDYFLSSDVDIGDCMIPRGLPNGSLVPETLDVRGLAISVADAAAAAFQDMCDRMCRFPTKLILEAIDIIAR